MRAVFPRSCLFMPTIILALLLTLAGSIAAAQSAPAAHAVEREFHFGSVKQGAPLAHTFVFQNTGSSPLRILAVEMTPPLRLSRIPAYLEPGARIEIPVTLDTTRLSGEYEGQVRLRLDDPSAPFLDFVIAGSVSPPVEFRPFAAFFIAGQRGVGGEDSIDVINHEDRPLHIVGVDAPADRLTTRLETIEQGRRYRLTVGLRPDGAAGTRQDAIVLRTDDNRRFSVVANTRLRERVYTFPELVDFGDAPARGSGEVGVVQTLMVYQVGGTDFRATFSTDVPGLQISAEPGPKGDRWQATLTLPVTTAAGAVRGSITIDTNDPEFPRVVVPLATPDPAAR